MYKYTVKTPAKVKRFRTAKLAAEWISKHMSGEGEINFSENGGVGIPVFRLTPPDDEWPTEHTKPRYYRSLYGVGERPDD